MASVIVLTNTSGMNLSLSATDRNPAVSLSNGETADLQIRDVQFDVDFLDGLIKLLNDGHIALTLGGGTLAARDLEDLKHTDVTEIEEGIVNPSLYKGTITLAADFPDPGVVEVGWLYRILAGVTDNDPTKTNTGVVFLAGDFATWTGATWQVSNRSQKSIAFADSPYTVLVNDYMLNVTTAGGVVVVTLPTPVGKIGQEYIIKDTVNAETNKITIATAAGTIDGAATLTISQRYGSIHVVSDGTNWLTIDNTIVNQANAIKYNIQKTITFAMTPYTVAALDSVLNVDTSGGIVVVTLPTPIGIKGKSYIVKDAVNAETHKITIATAAATIDGQATIDITGTMGSVEVVSNGATWMTVDNTLVNQSNATKLSALYNTPMTCFQSNQAAAASATDVLFIAPGPGTILDVAAYSEATAGVGESMTIDVTIGGVSIATATILLDTAAASTVQHMTIDTAKDDFLYDGKVGIVRTYVAGAGAMNKTYCTVTVR